MSEMRRRPLSRAARRRLHVAGGPVSWFPGRPVEQRRLRACLIALAILGALAGSARAIDFEPIPLHRLIGTAELVVSGRILEVTDEALHFEVERLLVGELEDRRIEVRGYTPWPKGASRPAPYAAGQSFVLALVPDPDPRGGPVWRIAGIGGEGEIPLVGRSVYFPGLSIDFLERRTARIHGVDVESSSYCASCFMAAVRDYGGCFAWQAGGNEDRKSRPEQICRQDALAGYRQRSRMHEYLTTATLRELEAD